jgi:hypothetical protein
MADFPVNINATSKENVSNKSTNVNTDQASNAKYPSVKALFDWATALFFPKPTGSTAQYLRGDGSLATFPTIPDVSGLVAKADYTPAHSVLVQQSGTGSPTPVQIGNNEFLGRKTGGGADIEGLSVSEVKSLLNYTASDVGAPSGSGTSTGTNTGDNFILSGSPVQSNAATGGSPRYYGFSDNANATVEINRRVLLPKACTLRNFYLRTSGTQPASGSHVFTVLKNGVATAITLTVPAGSAAGLFSDTTNQETFIGGDEVSIEAVNNASATSSIVVSFSIGVA